MYNFLQLPKTVSVEVQNLWRLTAIMLYFLLLDWELTFQILQNMQKEAWAKTPFDTFFSAEDQVLDLNFTLVN